MIIHDVKCKQCGNKTSSISRYCIHCFNPMPYTRPDNTPYGALALIAIIAVITFAMLIGNIVYAIFK